MSRRVIRAAEIAFGGLWLSCCLPYGYIRMLNQDITDLFERVAVGTNVVVLR